MKAIVLAAGKGERLLPLTKDIPKAMVELNGKPLLQYQIELLKKHGVKDIIVNLHYLPEKITGFFGNGKKFGVNITYSYEARLLGTAGAVKKTESHWNGPFLVLYGDVYSELDLGKLLAFHRKHRAIATLTLHESSHPFDSDIVVLDKRSRVMEIKRVKQGEKFANLTSAACYVLEPEICNFIPAGKEMDFAKELFPEMLQKGIELNGFVTSDYMRDIGTVERMGEVKKRLAK